MNGSLEGFQVPTKSKPRRTYLITYSLADGIKFPSRQRFGEAVANDLNSDDPKDKVTYLAHALEIHANRGKHYHLSLKLISPLRWLFVRNALQILQYCIISM